MPRKARIVLARYPHHIVQRGHNRQPVFAGSSDYIHYLNNIRDWKAALGCKVYAFCLMTNHIHLVIDPGDDSRALPLLMKQVAARQTRLVNRLEHRTGSLWESRYKSTPIDTDRYLLACCRYVEMNPVRANLVRSPAEYRWSSYRDKVGQGEFGWLDQDPCYLALGATPERRQQRYREWIVRDIPIAELIFFRQATQRGQLTGDLCFVDTVEAMLARRVVFRGQGRPRKQGKK